MLKQLKHLFFNSIAFKLIFVVGFTLLFVISAWAYFDIKYQKKTLMNNILLDTDKLANTIILSTHHAMMRDSRDDINPVLKNMASQSDFKSIRIYSKKGKIKYSNRSQEVDQVTNIKAEACAICHNSTPPLSGLDLTQRTRIFPSQNNYHLLGVTTPILNKPGCATNRCHAHFKNKSILGTLDVIVSLKNTDQKIYSATKKIIGLAILIFLVTAAIIHTFVFRFVNRPITKLIKGTQNIAKGAYDNEVDIVRKDEMGQLASAINKMGKEIADKQAELNRHKDEYQNLFEKVPCLITVHDREFRLIKYNREFAEMFAPKPGDYCYSAYKGRNEKCEHCPAEKTFQDGNSHYSQGTGINKDGTVTHWVVRTAPVKNTKGDIVAVIEMNLDVTPHRQLEDRLKRSEEKYRAIFNNIPNPVFVLDFNTLEILDCNHRIHAVYGYTAHEIIGESFMDFFYSDKGKEVRKRELRSFATINQAKHRDKMGRIIYVDIWVSPSEYSEKKVLLVTTSDITERLETEQQLIQAGKMAILGEMATGVAHELNQPLSVIKTASSFILKKINLKEKIDEKNLETMLSKMDSNVDRASNIITHMRQFARKSDMDMEKVQVNEVFEKSFEIFSQQLKIRGIHLKWLPENSLPRILADPSRLEQVFINLLVNARDAIEEKWEQQGHKTSDDEIKIKTMLKGKKIIAKVSDTGIGIPEQISGKLFEPFFTTKEVGKGTGLGLSISYGIIKKCKGQISTESTPNEGATFTISFPIPEDELPV